MTRENKLALVIGFGLLLLAGVLLSDHLSNDQRLDDDSLQAAETRWVADPDILHVNQQDHARTDHGSTAPGTIAATEASRVQEPPRTRNRNTPAPVPTREAEDRIVMGNSQSRSGTDAGTRAPDRTPSQRTHIVRKGDSLSSISQKFYGTSAHWKRIQRANDLANPSQMGVGIRLIIPDLTDGGGNQTRVATQNTRPRTTIVRDGENLSDIAKRELGNQNLWAVIWNANKDSLPDPDVLRVGMTLRIPVVTAGN
ncbi:MAG: LysM peptidoglycan-binding domain-containing protein [Phycisphaerales bacterium]|nr:LysM peptidoglycan-binding domain-containing protein [Phycisphaerales bacterium]